jgi:cell division protein FtsW
MSDLHNANHGLRIAMWKWWRGIDFGLMIPVAVLYSFSILLVTTASAAVAGRIGVDSNYFTVHHLFYVFLGFAAMFICSAINLRLLKKISVISFIICIILLLAVKLYGPEIKGAKRWISIWGLSMQPSEFVKPLFAIITAILFSSSCSKNVSFMTSCIVYMITATLLALQPDLGMLITLTGIWGAQLFVAGLPLAYIVCALCLIFFGISAAYMFLPHVSDRINTFLHPDQHSNYQISKSLLAFEEGGLFGKGPGEGEVKHSLPDSHADFIFSVAGEEFGAFACVIIDCIFCFIVLRSLLNFINQRDPFILLAGVGIVVQIALQSTINMGVALNLLPTKGMTLPFISYGGTSAIAINIAVGVLLSLSRNKRMSEKYRMQLL